MALPEDRSIDISKFPEKVRRFIAPEAPAQMKMMVARGMVPMKPLVQVCVLYQLQLTGDDTIKAAAVQAVTRLPAATVQGVAREPILAVVLDWMADLFKDQMPILRAILLNSRTDGDTFVRMARAGDEAITEAIALNQARLLTTPGLIQALYLNRNTRASTADRIVDFGVRNDVDLSDLPCYEEIVAAIKGIDINDAAAQAAADEAYRLANEALPEMEAEEAAAAEIAGNSRLTRKPTEEETVVRKSAAGRIRDLNIAQKVRLAMIGTRTERSILIRDTNKIVSRAVVRSPALTDSEAMAYAGIKSLPDEVVTYIAKNKKWLRHYQMKKLLVYNPKTPTGLAIRFLRFLRPGDLRSVARSRSVPGPVSKAAMQILKARMK